MESATQLSKEYEISDYRFYYGESEKRSINPPRNLISEYAEEKRILPVNTPFPGPWQNSRTPYSVEIMDCMSPFSPIQHLAIMKGAQLGLTALAENVIGYWIDESPSEILYVSSTGDLLKKWGTKRLEPLIDSCGFRDKIFLQTENPKSRRSGDLVFSKAFVGGNLDMASAQSASSLRSDSKRIIIKDEVDGAPELLVTGEGSWLDVADYRAKAWGHRKKILDISTPTTTDQSVIYPLFQEGDQRYYFVPCPLCGKMQALEFGDSDSNHGLKADTEAGKITSVYYLCEYCHDAIFNHHKTQMLLNGEWRPKSISSDPYFRSYYLSSLYSPIGMFSWLELWREYIKSLERPGGPRSFRNLCLGLPYRESGQRPKIEKVVELRGDYKAMTIPDGVLYVTAGVDVQTGSKTDKNNPARLEIELLGHGALYRTYSIMYDVIEGEIDDAYNGAWEKLYQMAIQGHLTFKRDDGMEFPVQLMLIDSGDGNYHSTVYTFTQRMVNTYPSKGFSSLKKGPKKQEGTEDVFGASNYVRYKIKKVDESINLVEISTNNYKNTLYNRLKIERRDTEPQAAGFCDFPIDYSVKYYTGLTAEELRTDGSFYCPSGRRNEPLDCRVMNNCAGDLWLNSLVQDKRAEAKNLGANPIEIKAINQKFIIDHLIKLTLRVIPT